MRARSRVALTIGATLTFVLAACSGSGSAPMPASTAAASPTPSGSARSGSPASKPPISSTKTDGPSSIAISGAMTTSIVEQGFCTIDSLNHEDFKLGLNTADEDFWMLSVEVRKFTDHGPGEFQTGSSIGMASVTLTDGMLHSFDAASKAGTVTIDAGQKSGSIKATLLNKNSGESVLIDGRFACSE